MKPFRTILVVEMKKPVGLGYAVPQLYTLSVTDHYGGGAQIESTQGTYNSYAEAERAKRDLEERFQREGR